MRGPLEKYLSGADEPSESASEYNGLLSYSAEWHAVSNGFFKGAVGKAPSAVEPDSKKEIHYYRGAYVLGRGVQLLGAFGAGHLL